MVKRILNNAVCSAVPFGYKDDKFVEGGAADQRSPSPISGLMIPSRRRLVKNVTTKRIYVMSVEELVSFFHEQATFSFLVRLLQKGRLD